MNEMRLNLPDDATIERSGVIAQAANAVARGDDYFRGVLDALTAAVYITDAAGLITYYNEAAAALWGRRPELGIDQWCGSWKLFWPDGRQLPLDECPMALTLREERPVLGMEAIAERPDGSRVSVIPYPTPLYDASGALIGAVNMLVDVSERKLADVQAQRLASIVESSDDAIIGKDLNGIIASWNCGAQRVFGYTAEEMIGRPVSVLIPPERENEEPGILQRIRRGERIDHYETVRRRKDGSLVDISLTVSPIRNAAGEVIGASKVARDITERRRARDEQQLLLREMDHRIKNLFALASSVVSLSARTAGSPAELATSVRDRLGALARAHALTLSVPSSSARSENPATLHALIKTIVSPYENQAPEERERVTVTGADAPLSNSSVTSLALLLHEFTTNAAKYGALSTPEGRVDVHCEVAGDKLLLNWNERGGPVLGDEVSVDGFGSMLIRSAIEGQLGGAIARDWQADGLAIRLSLALDRLSN
ncbi:sensor histidine kinase [Methylocapsa sp. S129]|uniref:sensor histidine kinase n=1 Tax=Methylocapsa sp. S129 TaxID=1641869 RepID=UPI00131C991D|nr:PAS domain S-box protein [Methylocapsa sp. S129]